MTSPSIPGCRQASPPTGGELFAAAILRRPLGVFISLLGLLLAGGAGCPRTVAPQLGHAALSLPPAATLNDVIAAVNQNTSRVQSLTIERATISGSDLPTLSALVAVERPANLRLRAKTAFAGPEIDVGSNQELFWFWVRRNDPPAVYFCRHEQFSESKVQRLLPVEPRWLIDALGLVTFDPAGLHRGPIQRPDGRLEIQTMFADAPDRPQRVFVIDPARSVVLEQHVLDGHGQRLATATASEHRRDPLTNVTLPGVVQIEWPPAEFSLAIELRDPLINQPRDDAGQLWVMPQMAEASAVDIGSPDFQLPPPPLRSARAVPVTHLSPLDDDRSVRGPARWLGGWKRLR